MKRNKTGIHRLDAENAKRADWLLWGREVNQLTRRGFLRGPGYAAVSAALGTSIPFAHLMPVNPCARKGIH